MKLHAGIDLHSNNSMVVIIDEQDRVMFEKRLPNELERILFALASFKQWLVGVVVESTYNWYWLVDGLMQSGYSVHLAHPAALVQYQGLTQQSVNKSTTIQLSATANGLNLHEARWTDIGSPDAGDDSADGD